MYVITVGYYEWKWLNKSGSKKEIYLLTIPPEELFAFSGIYSTWIDSEGNHFNSYLMITTEANELMSEVHTAKKRMPHTVKNWLQQILI